jgi:hypothetical protein
MREWKQVSVDADIEIYFYDPHAPCNERPTRTSTACYADTFPEAPTYPSTPSPTSTPVAAELNDRPRNASPSPSRSKARATTVALTAGIRR